MRLERRLDRWTTYAGLDTCSAAGLIDLEDPVELAQIKADDAGKFVADDRLDAADNRGAAPARDNCDLGPARPVENGAHLRFIRGQRYEVWCIGEVAVKGSNSFRIGLPISVQESLVEIAGEQMGQPGRRRQARRAQADVRHAR